MNSNNFNFDTNGGEGNSGISSMNERLNPSKSSYIVNYSDYLQSALNYINQNGSPRHENSIGVQLSAAYGNYIPFINPEMKNNSNESGLPGNFSIPISEIAPQECNQSNSQIHQYNQFNFVDPVDNVPVINSNDQSTTLKMEAPLLLYTEEDESFNPKTCKICEEKPSNNDLALCQYCLIDYRNAIQLDVLDFCNCDGQHIISACWRCVLAKCLSLGINKELAMSVEMDALPLPNGISEIPPWSQDEKIFIPLNAFRLADRALPESEFLLSILQDSDVLSSSYQESAFNYTLWATSMPCISIFTPQEQMQIIRSGFLPVLYTYFAFRLAQFLPTPHVSDAIPVQKSLTPLTFDDFRSDSVFLFSLEELEILKHSMTSNECRFMLYLCSALGGGSEFEQTVDSRNELNRLTLTQRYVLRKIFDLAEYFRDLKYTTYTFHCLSLVLLYEPEKPQMPEEIKTKMGSALDEAYDYFRAALNQLSVPVDEYLRVTLIQQDILTMAAFLCVYFEKVFVIPERNIQGLYCIINQIVPQYIAEKNRTDLI